MSLGNKQKKRVMPRRLTTKEFIEQAVKVHGTKFDYKLVEYINNQTNVKVICSKHGIFNTIPRNHIHLKSGCPKCYGHEKKTTEQFIKDAQRVHGDKYDYSLVDYRGDSKKVIIVCCEHGKFEQNASNHLQGSGCPSCRLEQRRYLHNLGTEEFIKRAKKIHRNRYDYSHVKYVNQKTKVKIICPNHGVFKQEPQVHVAQHCGCPKCGVESKRTRGEQLIYDCLEEHDVFFEEQKTFKDCIYKKNLIFDFWLPKQETLIEFQGLQHYRHIPKYHERGNDTLETIQIRDRIKKEYAISKGYNLIEIAYSQMNKVNELLESVICSL